ncbi:MAG: glycosyltransferase family 4 protein [Nitrospiria bacterium]
MKILVIENQSNPKEKPWWLKYVEPCAKAKGITLDVENISDEISIRNLFINGFFVYLLKKSRRYDWVITYQDGISTFLFGIARRFLNKTWPDHAVLEFITREKGSSLYDRVKYLFVRFTLKRVSLITCSAKEEIQYYQKNIRLENNQVAFIPLYGDPGWLAQTSGKMGNYIVSAGRTLRDYQTLIKAVEGTDIHLVIVTSPESLGSLPNSPNIEVKFDIPQTHLIGLMRDAKLIVLALHDRKISSGQRVLIMAMALGKCCIVTKTSGTVDYIEDEKDGCFVAPYDSGLMRKKILELWNDPQKISQIEKYAREKFLSRHTIEQYATHLFSLMTSRNMTKDHH